MGALPFDEAAAHRSIAPRVPHNDQAPRLVPPAADRIGRSMNLSGSLCEMAKFLLDQRNE
ncbi:hypothetical protein AYJ54_00935 [Bradyrhizobium centrolobii]|uniref:Uncharacterized protein n=1 Tax=Bradyrhizobium centrolobii TaxID=1505087 RepID=A0A176YFT8_9BRAD|nr:hypothetical protein AYJ54_00935 [Bradyrhizobium centrolobii]